MRCPAGVWSSQSTTAEASSTIIAYHVPRATVPRCPGRSEAVCACADAHEIRPKWDAPRSHATPPADNRKATCPPSQLGLSDCDEEHLGHSEPEPFLPCYQPSCM